MPVAGKWETREANEPTESSARATRLPTEDYSEGITQVPSFPIATSHDIAISQGGSHKIHPATLSAASSRRGLEQKLDPVTVALQSLSQSELTHSNHEEQRPLLSAIECFIGVMCEFMYVDDVHGLIHCLTIGAALIHSQTTREENPRLEVSAYVPEYVQLV